MRILTGLNDMKIPWKDKSSFFCFTPEVMLVTFVAEFLIAAYAYLRFRGTLFGKLSILILLLLGSFQFAEYRICTGDNMIFWARLGFIIITLLPPLGIHLVSIVTGNRNFLRFAYTLAGVFILIFAFVPRSITGGVCGGNYIIFSTAQELYWTYGVYYLGLLFIGIFDALGKLKGDRPWENKNANVLLWMILGYFSFMVPMGLTYFIFPETAMAVASVMCGFALTFAFILGFIIAKKYDEIHKS